MGKWKSKDQTCIKMVQIVVAMTWSACPNMITKSISLDRGDNRGEIFQGNFYNTITHTLPKGKICICFF